MHFEPQEFPMSENNETAEKLLKDTLATLPPVVVQAEVLTGVAAAAVVVGAIKALADAMAHSQNHNVKAGPYAREIMKWEFSNHYTNEPQYQALNHSMVYWAASVQCRVLQGGKPPNFSSMETNVAHRAAMGANL